MRLLRALPLALILLACGDDDAEPALPPLTWTWVPVEGSVCGDGSPTGVGIERGPGDAPDVLFFLMGGGACWETLTCFLFETAETGPYDAARFEGDIRTLAPGSILDRAVPGNPFRDFTFVFVPYCTGDVHVGDRVQRYPESPRDWHHRGRANLAGAFAHLATVLEPPGRVVVSGASAGGFGALFAFGLARDAWPAARGYLVDDSGPPLDAIPQVTVEAWYAAWGLGDAVAAICGDGAAACREDLSRVIPAVAARHPGDRLALLSSTEDTTMRDFFGAISLSPPGFVRMPAAEFEASLRRLAAAIEDDAPPGETHAFVVPGPSHTMLGDPAAFASGGLGLLPWLGQMIEDDPAWASAVPPP